MSSNFILGMHNSWQSGAAILCDEKIIAAVSEERFTRIKDCSGIPNNSIQFALNQAGISLYDLKYITYGMVTGVLPDTPTLTTMLEQSRRIVDLNFRTFSDISERVLSEIRWNEKHLSEFLDWAKKNDVEEKTVLVDHHTSHAAGAFFTSGFDESLVVTFDGKGNFRSGSSFSASLAKGLVPLSFKSTFDSLGYFYGNVTKAIGFEAERHEGKVTGLAAFGDPLLLGPKFRELILTETTNPDFNLKWNHYYKPWFLGENELPLLYELARTHSKEDIAAGAQWFLETVVLDYINYILDKFGTGKMHNLCVSGGIFANVKLNQKISELARIDKFYVQPAMGDMGIPLGSALQVQQLSKLQNRLIPVPMMNLGPGLEETANADQGVENFHTGKVVNPKEVFAILMDLNLAVGLVQGRMEFGPRALCFRSIVCPAEDVKINQDLNTRLNRSEFMPFAPVTTTDFALKCFLNWSFDNLNSKFMTQTFSVTERFKSECPATVHVDGTARPQVISTEHPFFDILNYYLHNRNKMAIINTSFNTHEEPIVSTLSTALQALSENRVDVVFTLDKIYLRKTTQESFIELILNLDSTLVIFH